MPRLHMVLESSKPPLLQGVASLKTSQVAANPSPWQGYDTTSYEIGSYYGLSFEMAREFCQVSIFVIQYYIAPPPPPKKKEKKRRRRSFKEEEG